MNIFNIVTQQELGHSRIKPTEKRQFVLKIVSSVEIDLELETSC